MGALGEGSVGRVGEVPCLWFWTHKVEWEAYVVAVCCECILHGTRNTILVGDRQTSSRKIAACHFWSCMLRTSPSVRYLSQIQRSQFSARRSPIIILVLLPTHRALPRPQRFRQPTRQTSPTHTIRRAPPRIASTTTTPRIHRPQTPEARLTIPHRCRRWNRFSASRNWALGRWCWWSGSSSCRCC